MKSFFGVSLRDEKRLSWKIAGLYAVVAAFWFLLSDKFLALLTNEPEITTWLHILNDWFYVLATAVLVGWMVRRQVRALRREDELMRAMAQGISVAAGETFFTSLTRNLTDVLEMEAAFICEVRGSPPVLKTVAARIRGQDDEKIELDANGTLLPRLLQGDAIRYPERVREELPGIPLLAELSSECFLGLPLIGADGNTLGLLAVASGRPLPNVETAETVLSVFAVRSAIELERHREQTQLRRGRDFFEQLVEALPGSLAVIGSDGRVRMANEQLLQASGQRLEQVVGRDFLIAFVPEEERPKLAVCLNALAGTAGSVEIEGHLLIEGGRRLPMVWRLRSRLTANGRPDHIIGLGIAASGIEESDAMS